MRVIFCGGGTSGHIYPAIAMADIIKTKYKDAQFLFIGRYGGDENRAIEAAGYRLRLLRLRGLKRSLSPKNALAILEALRATEEAKEIIGEFAPDVIIGTGGYVTWPVIRAGIKLGIPTAIHESNAIPGLVTKLLARGCDAVMLGVKEAEKSLPREACTIYVGNPVRADFKRTDRSDARRILGIPKNEFLIVSFGGSLGAEAMNKAIVKYMKNAIKKGKPVMHVHATGRAHYESVRDEVPELASSRRFKLLPYIENVPLWFSAADLAITRSGAMTIAEITECALPSILIPSPNVSGDHQRKNASVLAELGGAVTLDERDLSASSIERLIDELRSSPERIARMKKQLRSLAENDTTARILAVIDLIYEQKDV